MKSLRLALAAALITVVCALPPAVAAHAGASPTLLLQSTARSGGIGASMTFKFSWDYGDCCLNPSRDPNNLVIVLVWDDPAKTIGTGGVTAMPGGQGAQGAGPCFGTVTGTVPADTTGGDHFPSAYLEDKSNGNAKVPNSDASVPQGQQFTVTGVATPTPVPTPTPAPVVTSVPGTSATAQPTSATGVPVTPVGPTAGPLPPPSGRLPVIILGIIAIVLGGSLALALRRQRI